MGPKKVTVVGAGGWSRTAPGLTKQKRMKDGELIEWLVDLSGEPSSDLLPTAYERLKEIQSGFEKSVATAFVSIGFGILVYLGALDEFSAAGLKVASVIFPHAALVMLSVSGLWVCVMQTRQSFLRAFFEARFWRADPAHRTLLLIKYPAAFWYFYYMPANRGYPPGVMPKSQSIWVITPVVLILLLVTFAASGSLILWCSLALKIWNSNEPSLWTAKLTVLGSALIGLVGWAAPRFMDVRRAYVHYGLVNRLQRLEGERLKRAHLRVALARRRLGLVEASEN